MKKIAFTPSPMASSKSAFTIIELMVVVAIIATLSTIAIVSYFSHFWDTRDATRVTDLQTLDSRASILLSEIGRLPNPQNSVQLTASWTLVGRQGYASAPILSALQITRGGIDPKDKLPYVFTLDSGRRRAHFLAFFENSGPEKFTLVPDSLDSFFVPTAHAAVNYATRLPGGVGKFWVLLASGTLAPVQDALLDVDIARTTTPYVAYLQRNRKISWTGAVIAELNPTYSCARIRETGSSRSGQYTINPLGTDATTTCNF